MLDLGFTDDGWEAYFYLVVAFLAVVVPLAIRKPDADARNLPTA